MGEKPRESGVKIAVAVVAMGVALLLCANVAWTVLFGHNHGCGAAYESAAISGLRAYLGAQGIFQRKDRYGKGRLVYANPIDGKGFVDLWRVGGPLPEADGTELKLIDLAFARAASSATDKAGYWYVDIVADAVGGPYDYAKECGLCAVPAVYGKSGLRTFVVNIEGMVYWKDNGGVPVTMFPDVAREGWKPVGE